MSSMEKSVAGIRGVSWREKETLALINIWGKEKIPCPIPTPTRTTMPPAPGSKELFTLDLSTVDDMLLCTSIPMMKVCSDTAEGEEEEEEGSQEMEYMPSCDPAMSHDTDETLIDTQQEREVRGGLDTEDVEVTASSSSNEAPSVSTLASQGSVRTRSSVQEDELARTLLLNAEMSPESWLEKMHNRIWRVAVLNEVGEKMLENSRAEQGNTQQFQERWLQQEAQRHRELMEDGKEEREMMREAMQNSFTVMMAAIDQLKRIGDVVVQGSRVDINGNRPCRYP